MQQIIKNAKRIGASSVCKHVHPIKSAVSDIPTPLEKNLKWGMFHFSSLKCLVGNELYIADLL